MNYLGILQHSKESIVRNLIALSIFMILMIVSFQSFADTPNVSVGVAQGYNIIFKDGPNSGAVNTRLHIIMNQKLNDKVSLGLLIGLLTDNTVFKPMPRVAIMANVPLTEKSGISVAGLYQFNYDYGHGGRNNTHSLSMGVAPTYKLSGQFSAALFVSMGKTLHGLWGSTFQPAVAYRF